MSFRDNFSPADFFPIIYILMHLLIFFLCCFYGKKVYGRWIESLLIGLIPTVNILFLAYLLGANSFKNKN